MDAPEPNCRPLFRRLSLAWLAVLIALGLWQGYGTWLLGGGASRAF
ncbi:MAG TPA: hypothetical protein VIV63_15805 [Steroidobacteraceae bacterium]